MALVPHVCTALGIERDAQRLHALEWTESVSFWLVISGSGCRAGSGIVLHLQQAVPQRALLAMLLSCCTANLQLGTD